MDRDDSAILHSLDLGDRLEPRNKTAFTRCEAVDCELRIANSEESVDASFASAPRFERRADTEVDAARRREAGRRLWKRLLSRG